MTCSTGVYSGIFLLGAFLSVPFVLPPSSLSPCSAAKVLPCGRGTRVLPLRAGVPCRYICTTAEPWGRWQVLLLVAAPGASEGNGSAGKAKN